METGFINDLIVGYWYDWGSKRIQILDVSRYNLDYFSLTYVEELDLEPKIFNEPSTLLQETFAFVGPCSSGDIYR